MPDAPPETPALRRSQDYRWAEVDLRRYKDESAAPFKAITRQTLFSDPRLAGELRYFEIDELGYSTLERHEHMHAVMILRGRGEALVGAEVLEVKERDLVTIPPWTWHQFRAPADAKLGFLCLVNAERDRPVLPTEGELAEMRGDERVARFLDGG
jgi:quercetin dioxygenase-like cupin family protein